MRRSHVADDQNPQAICLKTADLVAANVETRRGGLRTVHARQRIEPRAHRHVDRKPTREHPNNRQPRRAYGWAYSFGLNCVITNIPLLSNPSA